MRGAPPDRPRPAAPLAPVALGLASGAALALAAEPVSLGLGAAPLLLLWGAVRRRHRGACWAALLGLLLGITHRAQAAPPPWLARRLPCLCVLEGTVRSVAPPARRVERFVLDVEWIGRAPGRRRLDRPVQLSLWTGRSGVGLPPGVARGARLRCVAHLQLERRTAPRGSGPYLAGRVPAARALEVLRAGAARDNPLLVLRRRAAHRFRVHLAERDAGLACALLLGDRRGLAPGDRRAFREAGQAHLLAVSGVHVGLLLAGIVLLLRRLGCPLRATWLAGVVAAALYVPFTGAPASAVRAGLAAALYFLGGLLGRPVGAAAVLSLVATIVLVAYPAALLDVSFRLSFAAVIGIFAVGPRLYDALVPPRPVVPGVMPLQRAPVRRALAVALAAWLGTAPFVALHVGRLCPAGALISLAAIPLAALVIASGFALLLVAPLPALAGVAAGGFGLAAGGLRGVLDLAGGWGLGDVPVAAPGVGDGAFYAAGFLLAARRGGRRLALGLGTMAGVLLRLCLVAPATRRARAAAEYHPPTPSMSSFSTAAVQADPAGVALLGVGLLGFALLTVRPLRWLTPGGAAGAWVLGVASAWSYGWAGVAAVFAPFAVGTLLGRLPAAERGGPRNLRQVACNGSSALLGCLAAVAGEGILGLGLFTGGLACLGADTCATEIGVRYGGRPFRLAGRGPVARGESGGVTAVGLLASLGGALLAPVAFALLADAPLGLVTGASAAGVAGALLDSVLGGTLQYRGRHPDTGALVEARRVAGRATERRSGLPWLDNDAVNLVSGLTGGLLAVALLALL